MASRALPTRERCQAHYAPGTSWGWSRVHQAQGTRRGSARGVFATPDRGWALGLGLGLASSAAEKWRQRGYPKVAEHIEEHVEECLTCLSFPEGHRRRTRTTNGLERLNQEIKRRRRVG